MSALPPIIRTPQSAPKEVREAVYARDSYTCQDCGKQGQPGIGRENIQVHHLINWTRGGDHSPENLITLCLMCHRQRERPGYREGYRKAAARRATECQA